jgi:hypothetical protein
VVGVGEGDNLKLVEEGIRLSISLTETTLYILSTPFQYVE